MIAYIAAVGIAVGMLEYTDKWKISTEQLKVIGGDQTSVNSGYKVSSSAE